MFETIGAPELIIIALVVVLLFGVGKVGRLGKDLGQGVREFRRAMNEDDEVAAPTTPIVFDQPGAYLPRAVSSPPVYGQRYAPAPQQWQTPQAHPLAPTPVSPGPPNIF